MKVLYCVRIAYFDGEYNLLFTDDIGSARGFFQGYCERIKSQEQNSPYVTQSQWLELISYPMDQEIEKSDSKEILQVKWRDIVGHSGKKT